MDLDWERPELITNALIDIDLTKLYNLDRVVTQLKSVGCKAIQIRIFEHVENMDLDNILTAFSFSIIRHIEILVPYSSLPDRQSIIALCEKHPRVNFITLHSSPSERLMDVNSLGVSVFYIEQTIQSEHHCGVVNPSMFNVNIESFLEAITYNSCLNKKISVDKNGLIKNCPSMPNAFGHINNDNFIDIINNPEFTKDWKTTKDVISVCKDCEFRFICTDCRAYTLNQFENYSKPIKCNYDPYEAKWKN